MIVITGIPVGAPDQEIARLNRVVDAQRDQNIINQVVAALKGTTTPAQ